MLYCLHFKTWALMWEFKLSPKRTLLRGCRLRRNKFEPWLENTRFKALTILCVTYKGSISHATFPYTIIEVDLCDTQGVQLLFLRELWLIPLRCLLPKDLAQSRPGMFSLNVGMERPHRFKCASTIHRSSTLVTENPYSVCEMI